MAETDYTVHARLPERERKALEVYAARKVQRVPALRGRLYHIDGRPKISAILRFAAAQEAGKENAQP